MDGGANQWFKYIAENKLHGIETPHLLTGDMDSISNDSSDRLKAMNCQVIPTPDQSETDCTKSLIVLQSYIQSLKVMKTHKNIQNRFKMSYRLFLVFTDKEYLFSNGLWRSHRSNDVTNQYIIQATSTRSH